MTLTFFLNGETCERPLTESTSLFQNIQTVSSTSDTPHKTEKKTKTFIRCIKCTYRFPLRSNNFPLKYHSTDGSGIPRGGVQFMTTWPPTSATESRGTNRKSSFSTETNEIKLHFLIISKQSILYVFTCGKNFLIIISSDPFVHVCGTILELVLILHYYP